MTLKTPIGFFGGTFNPPHIAHFALAHAAQQQLQLAQVEILPAGQPWQKKDVLPTTDRVNMLRLAIKDDCVDWQKNHSGTYPLSLNTLESEKAQPSYTINTLKTLRQGHPNTPLVWIMGSDQLKNLPTWHNWQYLLDYAHIAVAQRAGHEINPKQLKNDLHDLYTQRVCHNSNIWHNAKTGHFLPFTLSAHPISSSMIRSELYNGTPANNINALHLSVAEYIVEHRLYQP